MLFRADVKCYYCGHVSGQVQGDPEDPHPCWSFQPAQGSAIQSLPTRTGIRCLRCGGPVFLDEIEAIHPRARSEKNTVMTATH
jgi:hypothetical protein